MNLLRKIISESIQIAENIQQADKIYFNTSKLSSEVKRYITHITEGDAWTKLLTDIYYAELLQQHKQGKFALSVLAGDDDEEDDDNGEIPKNDLMDRKGWEQMRIYHNWLKAYNKNVFPIKGFNISGVKDIWNLISGLKQRASIIELMKQLPTVAKRNMTDDIRTERTYPELQHYRSRLEYFLAQYSQLSNRSLKAKSVIDKKMFKSGITIEDLVDFAEDKQNLIGGKQLNRSVIKKILNEYDYNLQVVYDKGNVMVIDVTGPDGIKALGCNSVWCFTYGGTSGAYSNRGSWNENSTNGQVYVIIDFSQESDSPYFMYTIVKPLDFTSHTDDSMGDVKNQEKMANMSNEYVDNPLDILSDLMGAEDAYQIINFGEERTGPTSKWPYEDPNQTKLDLKEVRKMIRQQFLKESKSNKFLELVKDLIAHDGKIEKYSKITKIKDWPKVPGSEGFDDELGTLDLENNEYISIDDKKLILITGGDWQDPWVVEIGLKNGALQVLNYRKSERGEYKKRKQMKVVDITEKIYEDDPMHDNVSGYLNLVKKHLKGFMPMNNSYGDEDYKDEIIEGPKINSDGDGVYIIWNVGGHDKNINTMNSDDEETPEESVERRFVDWVKERVWSGKKQEFKIDGDEYKIIPNMESLGNDNVKYEIKIRQKKIHEELQRMVRTMIEEAKKTKFKKLEDNKVPLTDEERKKVMDADAVWHHGPGGAPSPAVWKSVDKNGKVIYITNTHRAYQARPTLKGAISIYHSFIKGTS